MYAKVILLLKTILPLSLAARHPGTVGMEAEGLPQGKIIGSWTFTRSAKFTSKIVIQVSDPLTKTILIFKNWKSWGFFMSSYKKFPSIGF